MTISAVAVLLPITIWIASICQRIVELRPVRARIERANALPETIVVEGSGCCFDLQCRTASFSVQVDFGESKTNVVLNSNTRGIEVFGNGLSLRSTPIISDFPYKRSVFFMMETEESVMPSLSDILFMSQNRWRTLLEKLIYKVSTGDGKTRVCKITKDKMICCAYLCPTDALALLTVDSGTTNTCVSLNFEWNVPIAFESMVDFCCNVVRHARFTDTENAEHRYRQIRRRGE